MTPTAPGVAKRVPLLASDCFVLALDAMMQRTGQGRHVSQSVLELDHAPDLARLRAALERVVAKHPLLLARQRRSWKTWLPYWDVPAPPAGCALPLGLWRETGSPGNLPGATRTDDASARLQEILAEPLPLDGMHFNARVDLAELGDGRCLLALSWSHLLLDGKGAELLLVELARLAEGINLPDEFRGQPEPGLTLRERFLKTKPAMLRFDGLRRLGIPSLGGPRPRGGRGFYQVLTLDAEESATVRARCEQTVGELFPVAFNVACVARAHDRIFRHRGRVVRGLAGSVPVQKRRRGARGPLFHNHVTALYFCALREHLGTLAGTAAAMKQQFAEMTRLKISDSFDAVQGLMARVPASLFMRVVRWQFRGEICSFFHSHTGPFAPELLEFAGARIANAYHLPCIAAPPGTGIFFSERDGCLNITLSWREGCLSDEERQLMVAQLRGDLLGETQPAAAVLAHGGM